MMLTRSKLERAHKFFEYLIFTNETLSIIKVQILD